MVKNSTGPKIYFHFPVQKFLCVSSPFKNTLNIVFSGMLPKFRWEKSLANVRLHIFLLYVEAEVAFGGLLCPQWRQREFSICPSLRKYVYWSLHLLESSLFADRHYPRYYYYYSSLKCT